MKKLFITLVIVMLMGVLTACGKTTINLNDYVTITTEGYDTMGTATYKFDSARFEEDFEEKIKVKKADTEIKMQLAMGFDAVEIFEDMCIDFERGENANLSNGDVLTLKWNCDDETAKTFFGCKLKYEDISHTVSGLTEVEIFDPLAYITVNVTGVSPRAEYEYTVDETQPLMKHFVVSVDGPSYGVANGDVITVSAHLHYSIEEDKFLQEYGIYPGGGKKEITVEGLPTMVRNYEEFPQDKLAEINATFESAYRAEQDELNNGKETELNYIKEITYLGYYFTVNEMNFEAYNNYILLIYKVNAWNPKTNELFDYYVYSGIRDVAEKDGEIIMGDVMVMGKSYPYGSRIRVNVSWRESYQYIGCMTMEELEGYLDYVGYDTTYKYMLGE